MRSPYSRFIVITMAVLATVTWVALEVPGETTLAAPQSLAPAQSAADHLPPDLACRLCHRDTDATLTFPSGESLDVVVDLAELDHSAHGGDEALLCTDCHQATHYRQPHAGPDAADVRQYEIASSASCERCHGRSHLTSHDEVAPPESVTCTDCHGAHDVAAVSDWPAEAVSGRCLDCHEPDDRSRLEAITAAGLFTGQTDQEYCLACHLQPGGPDLTLPDGESLSVQFDAAAFAVSVHGEGNDWGDITCRHCHEITPYPHPPVEAPSSRQYALAYSNSCGACHDHNVKDAEDSVHAAALAGGEIEAAVCTDCHGAHAVPPASEPRSRVSQTCHQCHSTIFDEYASSVHGADLLGEENEDVPTCTSCHGVHNIGDPTTALFRLQSPTLCAGCHANEALMAEYDISTNVFDSYVADFHGTTVTLFEHQDPNAETNKAVCYDCHGIHAIKAPDDPDAGIKSNLLATCQQCHPDATGDFPDAWTSHFEPSLQHNPLVFLVNKFYAIVIPVTVGGLGFLVATDIFRRARPRRDTLPRGVDEEE